ncbi:UCH-domain-containing protein [Calocera viscosa TUFC12733]|uniref:ubiquitinyl hydrolase 1 n=1 Tax=Calocera viscosa (strain TUFC12733) TaxID=1330018 RepID=A0A167RZA9_CALVF|nr:UCH-domain-containing protein [Calocera viscosa TUFC12733]
MAAQPVPSPLESRKRLRSPSSSSVCSTPKRQASEDPSDSPNTPTPPSTATPSTTLTIPLESQLSLQSPASTSTSELPMQTPTESSSSMNQPLSPEPADTLVPPHDRWSHIVGLRNASQIPGATWHLVSSKWLKRLEIACTGKAGKDEELVTQETLGPVDNSDIVDADGELRRDLEGDEYEPLPQEAWDALQRWYGPSSTPLSRTVYAGPSGSTMLHYHPHLFRLFLLTTSPPMAPSMGTTTTTLPPSAPLLRLYEPQPLADLYAAASSQLPVLSLPKPVPTPTPTFRLWRLDEAESADLIKSPHYPLQRLLAKGARLLPPPSDMNTSALNPPLTIQGSLLSSGDCLMMELLDETGKYPITNPQSVPGNSSAVPSPAPSNIALPPAAPLFGSGASNAGQKDFFSRYESEAAKGAAAPLFSVKGLSKSTNFGSTSAAVTEVKGKEKEEKKGKRGTMGLANLGNTCFMNSALQCLAHTEELAEYFLTGVFRTEINRSNPLGMGGQIAEAFGALMNRLWAPVAGSSSSFSSGSSYSPREFKSILAKFAPQFSGYMQHDSQELLAFLLDGLHEDLNRVLKKPYVEKPDWPGKGGPKELIAFAEECWDGYLKRNDSVIVDLFQGQYKSTLVCPECGKVSITFDPYMYLTLPLPVNRKWRGKVHFIPWSLDKPRQRITLELPKDADFKRLKQHVGALTGADPAHLLAAEPYQHVFWKLWEDAAPVGDINTASDDIALYELPCSFSQLRAQGSDRSSPVRLADSSWILVPIFLSTPRARYSPDSRFGTRRFGGGEKFPVFGQPFMLALTRQEASNEDVIYERIAQRLSQVTSRKLELYDDDVLPVTPAPPNTETLGPQAEVEDATPPREQPEEAEASTSTFVPPPSQSKLTNGEPVEHQRSWTARKNMFKMHILQHNRDLGEGHLVTGWSIETTNRVVDFADRKEEVSGTVRVLPGGFQEDIEEEEDAAEGSSEDPYKPLLRLGEAIMCEWNAEAARYFFDDQSGTWDEFKDLTDPGIATSDDAEKAAGKKDISLYDCMSEFTREEQLGEDDLWYCPQCKKHRQATKKFEIWSVPDILVVHLKRFSSGRLLRDKLDMMVDFPLEGLDLEGRVEEKLEWKRMREQEGTAGEKHGDPEEEPIVYDLFAVDEHLGGLGGGHYRAYAKNYADGQWYHFDDSHVSLAVPSAAVNRNAYLLFYRRRTARHLGGKTHEKIEEARKAGPPPVQEDADQPVKSTNPFRDVAPTRSDYSVPLPLLSLLPPASGMISPASSESSDSGGGPAYSPPSPPAFDLSGNDPLLLSSNLDLEDSDAYNGQLIVRGAAPSPFSGSASAEMGDSGIITPLDSEMDDVPASSDAWEDDQPGENGRFARAFDDDDELTKGYLPTPPDVEMNGGELQKSQPGDKGTNE